MGDITPYEQINDNPPVVYPLIFARPEYQNTIKTSLQGLIHVPFKFEFEGSKVIHAN